MSVQSNSRRVIFPKGIQTKFLTNAKEKLNFLSWTKFAKKLSMHPRVLNDWKREQGTMPENMALKIAALSKIDLPDSVKFRDRFWYTSKGGKVSGKLLYEKYGRVGGDPDYRKKQWYKWWEKGGHHNNLGDLAKPREITIPVFSEKLAEFVGIILGDGGITDYQVKVSLDSKNDAAYVPYVAKLFGELFDVKPSLLASTKDRVTNIVVSRTSLVSFLESIGLFRGNKTTHQVDIPQWIKDNPAFARRCVRGLMDTDGSIFNEVHKIKEKIYSYPRIYFVSHSKPLRLSVQKILTHNGFSAKIRSERAVTLEKREDVIGYFKRIGSSNPKHLARFKEYTGGVA